MAYKTTMTGYLRLIEKAWVYIRDMGWPKRLLGQHQRRHLVLSHIPHLATYGHTREGEGLVGHGV